MSVDSYQVAGTVLDVVPFPPSLETTQWSQDKPERRWRHRITSEGGLVLLLPAGLYLVVGVLLDFRYGSFNGDAMSRMANGFYVFYSLDPHLASIGFVWNPLTSVLDMGPLLFYHLWMPLASRDMAGSIVSSFCMAGAVYQARTAFLEWGVRRPARLVLTVLFAVNPMVVYYGGNGMSEGLYLLTLVASARYLSRWLRRDDTRSLIYAAIALGFCYLARNEAVLPAVLGGAVVFGRRYVRSRAEASKREASLRGLTDLSIFVLPCFVSFVGWAVASQVITGQAFAQFQSQYGTAAQLQAIGTKKLPLLQAASFQAHAFEYLAPLLPLVLLVALVKAWRWRDPLVLATLAIVGGGLAFDTFTFFDGALLWSFRYVIATVPLEVLVAGTLFAARPAVEHDSVLAGGGTTGQLSLHPSRWLTATLGGIVAFVLIAPSVPTTAAGMFNPKVGWQELQFIGWIPLFHRHLSHQDWVNSQHYPEVVRMADYISGLKLTNGDVVVDNFSTCIPEVIVNTGNPRVYVIPNDRSYQKTLADPLTFHAHYILVPPDSGTNSETTTDRLYSALYGDGAGFAKLVYTFRNSFCSNFRLYRVTAHPTEVDGQEGGR